jgi:chromate reductase, NAD(P)H dehydrogenase (quinone)
MTKILAFAGSNSQNSINKKLALYVAQQFTNASVESLDLNDYEMPIYSEDRQNEMGGVPALAEAFAQKIDSADFIILSLADHNGTYSAAFKNVYDWVSRIKGRKHWGEKNYFLLACSPGPGAGQSVMNAALARLPKAGANVVAHFNLGKFKETFSETEGILDAEKAQELAEKVAQLQAEFF